MRKKQQLKNGRINKWEIVLTKTQNELMLVADTHRVIRLCDYFYRWHNFVVV